MSSTSRSKGSPARDKGRERGEERRTTARKPEEVSSLEAHLGYWLRIVSNHVSHAFKGKVERQGVTVAEWVVLRALFDEDGVKPSELAQKIGLTRGAVSKLLDRLAAKQLARIQRDEADGRAQVVSLTSSGWRMVPRLAALADENDAETFGHLTAAQRETLRSALTSLVRQLGIRTPPTD